MKIASPLTTESRPILQWIEIASSLQLPSFHIIGLAGPEVAEARERVRAAIESSEFDFPKRRIVINLSPASIKKRGTGADLAMAVSILWAAKGDNAGAGVFSQGVVLSGELGLDGRVKPVGQVMRTLHAAWEAGTEAVLLAPEDFRVGLEFLRLLTQARLFSGPAPALIPVSTLTEAWSVLFQGELPESVLPPVPATRGVLDRGDSEGLLPLGPEMSKWIRIAAAGLHHLLLMGPRGVGKSHAFEWLIRLQPAASAQSQVRQILIRELLGPEAADLGVRPPVRRVGVQVRAPALCGTVSNGVLKPGEFSLAHGGILIADEFPEWSRDSREALREPLERGSVTLTRTQTSAELPARFVLAANGNLCPCGGWPRLLRRSEVAIKATQHRCICKDAEVATYLKRLSGPVLDRIDIIQMIWPSEDRDAASLVHSSDSLASLRERTARAQEMAERMYGSPAGLLAPSELESLLRDHPDWSATVGTFKNLGMRSRHKLIRIALSLAIYEHIEKSGSTSESVFPSRRHFEEAYYMRPEGINLHSASSDSH